MLLVNLVLAVLFVNFTKGAEGTQGHSSRAGGEEKVSGPKGDSSQGGDGSGGLMDMDPDLQVEASLKGKENKGEKGLQPELPFPSKLTLAHEVEQATTDLTVSRCL